MATKEEENKKEGKEGLSFDENDIFSSKIDQDEEEDDDENLFRGDTENEPDLTDTSEKEDEDDEEEDDDDDDELSFSEDEEEEEEDDEFTKEEIEKFNKRLDTDFKTSEELKNHFKKEDTKTDDPSKEEEEFETATNTIEQFSAFMGLDDEALMRRQYETIAVQKGKDINDDDVADEIEDQVQDLIDSKTISLHAKNLRNDINEKVIKPAESKKSEIETRRAEEKAVAQKTEKEQLQNALAEIYQSDFFGVKIDKKTLSKVYKDVNSGQFLDGLKSDKKAQAELAVLLAYKPEVYKKATGLTFSDGLKAATEDFDKKQKQNGESAMTKAQKRGTSGSSDGSKGLLSSLIADD
jgi:hypothetical protein